METITFGTYNLSNDGATLVYDAPGNLSQEMLQKITFGQNEEFESNLNGFDSLLKAVISVPKA